MGLFSITTSGFLAAFALALGANNLQIGILAAVPFMMQVLQIPTIWLVEKLRRRKAISVPAWFAAQLLWFPIALISGTAPLSFLLHLCGCGFGGRGRSGGIAFGAGSPVA